MAATPNTSSSGCSRQRTHDWKELQASATGRLRLARPLQGRNLLFDVFGPRLAKRTQERTCGTRIAGLRGAKLRPADPCGIDFVLTSQQLPVKVAMLPAKSVAERPAARSRPRAEGCMLASRRSARAGPSARLRGCLGRPRCRGLASDGNRGRRFLI